MFIVNINRKVYEDVVVINGIKMFRFVNDLMNDCKTQRGVIAFLCTTLGEDLTILHQNLTQN